ncbi:MAG: hypothetical protein R3F59_21575 [Myxococcota bacterium]
MIPLMLFAALPAWARDTGVGYQPPNSTLGVSGGTPWLVGARGEAWFADELSGEIGGGTLGEVDDNFGVDFAVRWRPDALCFGCESRALLTFGVAVAALIEPAPGFEGPWDFAVGPDLAATFVYWFGPTYGLAISARGGVGAGWTGDVFDEVTPRPWGFGTLGLAF